MKHRHLSALLSRLANRDGASAVEFAILAPVLILILAASIDFGGVIFTKFRLENTVSSAAIFAMNSGASVNQANGQALANTIGTIIVGSGATGGTVDVNHGPSATISNGAVAPGAGTAIAANSCYCPTPGTATGSVTWGSAVACRSTCADGSMAGRFVTIQASLSYTPLFSNYGFFDDNQQLSARAVVQTE